MNKHTAKRKRHIANQVLKFGTQAKRKHDKIGGRTGQVQSKRTPGKSTGWVKRWDNPPVSIGSLGPCVLLFLLAGCNPCLLSQTYSYEDGTKTCWVK